MAEGESSLRLYREQGWVGREAAEGKEADMQGRQPLLCTLNTLDPKPPLCGFFLPVCLHVHEYWMSAALEPVAAGHSFCQWVQEEGICA